MKQKRRYIGKLLKDKIFEAFATGKPLQQRFGGEWRDYTATYLNTEVEWRIKPK
jgi:hypothetical protein